MRRKPSDPVHELEDVHEGPLAGVMAEARSSATILMMNPAVPDPEQPEDPTQHHNPWQRQFNAAFHPNRESIWTPPYAGASSSSGYAVPWEPHVTDAPPVPVQVGERSYQVQQGATVIQMIPAEATVELPSFGQHEPFTFLNRPRKCEIKRKEQLTLLWSGATGGNAPSTLDPGQRQTTLNMHLVEQYLSTPEAERPRPTMTVIAPARQMSDALERRLSEFMMVQEYSEELRRTKMESGKGKGKRRHRPIPNMPPELQSMQEALRSRRSLDYLGDNQECTICQLDFEDGEVAVQLVCRHVFHTECFNDYAADGQRRSREADDVEQGRGVQS